MKLARKNSGASGVKILGAIALSSFLCLSLCPAETWYVSPGGSGNKSGANTNNRRSFAGINALDDGSVGGWTNIAPGDVISLSGTFSNQFFVRSGDVVIRFEANTKFSAPTWTNCFGSSGTASKSVIGGPYGYGPYHNLHIDLGGGVLEATDNGPPYAHSYSNAINFISFNLGANCSISNGIIRNGYQGRTFHVDDVDPNDSRSPIFGGTGLRLHVDHTTNLVVADITIDSCVQAITLTSGNLSYLTNLNMWGLTLTNCAGAIDGILGPNCLWDGIQIHDSGFYCGSTNWMYITNLHTHNWLIGPAQNPVGNMVNFTAWNCKFGEQGYGTGDVQLQNSFSALNISNVLFYNCIFHLPAFNTYGLSYLDPTSKALTGASIATRIANCTFVADSFNYIPISWGNYSAGESPVIRNCLFKGFSSGILWTATNQPVTNVDYSCWANLTGTEIFSNPNTDNGGQPNQVVGWPAWTNLVYSFGAEQHSRSNIITLNADLSPVTDIVFGLNLTSWGISNDIAGNLRPASGAWTIGAFEVNTNYVPPPPPGGAIAGYLGILK